LLITRNKSVADAGDSLNGRLDRLTRLVLESIDKNAALEIEEDCADDTRCRLARAAEYVDGHNSVPR
jgi:hypothetical protein